MLKKNNIKSEIILRPWGDMVVLGRGNGWWVKKIRVNAGGRLSLQSHEHRREFWTCVEGEVTAEVGTEKRILRVGESVHVPLKARHRLSSKTGGTILEVAIGESLSENDITRYEDDYGRV